MKSAKRYQRIFRRRIKRTTRSAFGSGYSIVRLLVVLALAGWAVFHAAERYPELLGPVVSGISIETVQGRVSHVRDGDTIEVEDVPIRLGSLDCAEMNTSAGLRAAARMRNLVSGEIVICHLNGRTSYDRKIGSCRLADGRDLGAVMIKEGLCRRF